MAEIMGDQVIMIEIMGDVKERGRKMQYQFRGVWRQWRN